jgi:hypothetical protein
MKQLEEQIQQAEKQYNDIIQGSAYKSLRKQLQQMSQYLPEILLKYPELDFLHGTAAQGLQQTCIVSNEFEHLELLFSNPRADVYKCQLKTSNEFVVLKKLKDNNNNNNFAIPTSFIRRLRKVAHIMTRVTHPNILSLNKVLVDVRYNKSKQTWDIDCYFSFLFLLCVCSPIFFFFL